MGKVLVPEQDVEKLILSGEYEFPEGVFVNVFNPEGKLVSISGEQVKDALQSGYRLESNYERVVRETADKLSGKNSDALKVFAAQLADEAAAGLTETFLDITADPFYIDVKEKIKERHKIANTLGGVLGFGASFLYGGPVAKIGQLATKAGEKAAETAARGAGIVAKKLGASERAIESAAKSVTAQASKGVIKYGTEGVVSAAPLAGTMLAGEAVNSFEEDKNINTDAAAETLLLNGGIGIVLGGGLGALGRVTKNWRIKNSQIIDDLNSPYENMYEQGGVKTAPTGEIPGDPNSIVNQAKSLGSSDEALERLKKVEEDIINVKIGKIKTSKNLNNNFKEIVEAHERLGLGDVLEEQIAKGVQADAEFIMSSNSKAGEVRRKKLSNMFDLMENKVKEVFNINEIDASEVGKYAKQRLIDFAQNSKRELGEIFDQVRLKTEELLIDSEDLKNLKKVLNKDLSKTFSSAERSIYKELINKIDDTLDSEAAEDVFKLSSVNDIKTAKTYIGKLIDTADAGERAAAKRVYSLLSELEEKTIDEKILNLDEKGDLFNKLKNARDNWKNFITTLEQASEDFGLGLAKNPEDFINLIKDAEPIILARKLAPKDKILQIERLKNNFPDIFEHIKQLKKNEMLMNIGYGDNLNIRRLVSNSALRKISKDELNLYFNKDEVQALKDIMTVVDSLPSRYTQDAFTSNTTRLTQQLNQVSDFLNRPGEFLADKLGGLGEGFSIAKAQRNIINTIREESADIVNNLKSIGLETKQIRKIISGLIYTEKNMTLLGRAIKVASDFSDLSINKLNNMRTFLEGAGVRLTQEDDHDKRFKEVTKKIAQIATNPDVALMENIETFETMRDSGLEKTTDKMIMKLQKIVNHLQENLPKSLFGFNEFRDYKEDLVSDLEKMRFLRMIEVVQNPFLIIDRSLNGVLTFEEIDTVSKIYPTIYNEIKKRMFDSLTKLKPVLTYSQRLNYSLMLGVNLDNSLDPFYLLEIQKIASKNLVVNEEERTQNININRGRKSGLANQLKTEVQRIEMRRG